MALFGRRFSRRGFGQRPDHRHDPRRDDAYDASGKHFPHSVLACNQALVSGVMFQTSRDDEGGADGRLPPHRLDADHV